jgi:NADPH:quinone reductase-like Zn-dependent oxidoreductase
MAKIPPTMRAAAIDRFGKAKELKIRELPVPEVDPGEVLIAVHTAGVGSWDADIRGGWWPGPGKPKFPLVLGTDGSGIVAAVGSRVRRFNTGDRVYGYSWMNPKGGFYAEFIAVAAENVAQIPKPLDLPRAGAVPVIGLTALEGIDGALRLKRGERIIIHGASGGVGTMAVQFAKLRGAKVFATASGKDGVALVRRLGADRVIDGRADITSIGKEFAPDGFDAVLALAGKRLSECVGLLRKGGRVAYPNGVEPAPRRRSGIKMIPYDGVPGVRQWRQLDVAITKAKPKVPISAEFSLADAAEAHRRVTGHVIGKIVLRVRR